MGEWTLEQTSGEGPPPLYLHSAVVYREEMYVFGGSVGRDSAAMYRFTFATKRWEQLQPVPNSLWPSARYGHSACVHGDSMILVGGCSQSTSYYSDAYQFSFALGVWRPLRDIATFTGAKIDLAYHSILGNLGPERDRVLCIGGYNGVRFSEQIYELTLPAGAPSAAAASASWNALPVTAKQRGPVAASGLRQPAPSCGAAIVATPDGAALYCFGGQLDEAACVEAKVAVLCGF